MNVQVTLNTTDRDIEIKIETTPNTPIKDIVAEACDSVELDGGRVVSYTIIGTAHRGELV